MLKTLFEMQKNFTDYFFAHFDLAALEDLLPLLLNCKGNLFFTGVGKSGLIAKKIALTIASTGTQAFYLCPTDALHGTLGILSANDICLFLSKSGESDELLALLPALRKKNSTTIAIVCNKNSRLAKQCSTCIVLPFSKELCPFDMAPTMSTTYQLLFGDLLTVALMKEKGFSLQQYASNHPAGRIGKRLNLQVQDIMLTGQKIPICKPHQTITEILVELSDKRCGCIVIVDTQMNLLGIFTDGDLRRSLQKRGSQILHTPVSEVMSCQPATIHPEELAWVALQQMEANSQKRITSLPVVDHTKKLLGLLHLHDLLQTGL